MRARSSGFVSRVSASTIRRSVPERGSLAANAVTPPLHLAGGFLQLHRVDVVAGADDQVFRAPGDEQLPADEVAEVAGVAPGTVDQTRGFLRIFEVAAGRRRPCELHPALRALAELAPALIDHAYRVAGQRAAAGHQAQRHRIVLARQARHAVALEMR